VCRDLFALICETAPEVRRLHRVSQLLVLSLAILRAVPHGDSRWLDFIEGHMRELNSLAHEVRDRDRTRLAAWVRFVRKYVRYGHTFNKAKRRLPRTLPGSGALRTARVVQPLTMTANTIVARSQPDT
jgi:hypothetical protein